MNRKLDRRSTVFGVMALTLLLLPWAKPLGAQSRPAEMIPAGPAVAFVANDGRLDESVRFFAQQGGMHLFCTDDSLVLQVVEIDRAPWENRLRLWDQRGPSAKGRAHTIVMRFSGARDDAQVEGLEQVPGVHRIRRGPSQVGRILDAPAYRTVRYDRLWPGVDLLVHAEPTRLQYDLQLDPGADLEGLVLECQGAESMRIEPNGDLRLETSLGPVFHSAPSTYQIDAAGKRFEVESSFRLLDGQRFGFSVPDRDPALALLIDPGLSFSSYLGGSAIDEAVGVAVDDSGAIVVAGITMSADFPTVPGPINFQGMTDIFVSKFDSTASSLIFSVVFGGSGRDEAGNLALDTVGAPYVVGLTGSADFPVTAGAFDTTFNGGGPPSSETDGFVTKLSPVDGSLIYSTYLGGAAHGDWCSDVAVDGTGRAHLAGATWSSDFPTTAGAFQTTLAGEGDGFVAVLDSAGSALVAATFLGGLGSDQPEAIALQESGDIVVAGRTGGDFPVVAGGFDMTPNDSFLTTLDASLSSLRSSTFLGGSFLDWIMDVDIGPAGSLRVVGFTESFDFPVTSGAFDSSFNGYVDGFVACLDSSASELLYSTYLGGLDLDIAWRLRVDAVGRANIVGWTASPDFPVVDHAVFPTLPGGVAAFLSQLGVSGGTYNYGTFFGGPDYTRATGIDLRPSGAVIVGETFPSLPTTPGAFDTTFNGGTDAFLAAIDDQIQGLGFELPGAAGAPLMAMDGSLAPGSLFEYVVRNAHPNSLGALFLGTSAGFSPLRGGILVPVPSLTFWFTTSPQGAFFLPGTWPPALPGGLVLYLQTWILDPTGPAGASATQGLSLTVP